MLKPNVLGLGCLIIIISGFMFKLTILDDYFRRSVAENGIDIVGTVIERIDAHRRSKPKIKYNYIIENITYVGDTENFLQYDDYSKLLVGSKIAVKYNPSDKNHNINQFTQYFSITGWYMALLINFLVFGLGLVLLYDSIIEPIFTKNDLS
jgi:hypothetical protein